MKSKIPNLELSTDIIVGFPGETEEDFEDTLDVVEKVNFEQVYMFIYSRRVGTPGDKMLNQIPDEIKHKRFDRLKQLVETNQTNDRKYLVPFILITSLFFLCKKLKKQTKINKIVGISEKYLLFFLVFKQKSVGISFMFLGLGTLRQTGIDMDLAHNQPVLEFFASFDPHSFQNRFQ